MRWQPGDVTIGEGPHSSRRMTCGSSAKRPNERHLRRQDKIKTKEATFLLINAFLQSTRSTTMKLRKDEKKTQSRNWYAPPRPRESRERRRANRYFTGESRKRGASLGVSSIQSTGVQEALKSGTPRKTGN
ncbi:hypothetical protein Nepgr_001267 [Nepenthes gracilis]|uniref:Uncharacterized protein n=1 Tax=Nepenthes gracilis TaxID=150966 RepID=A0AAD3P4W0_NEPGR|nr:hypothetical protein Nepgr_001267 [Nepenthes gracilis]